jgi:hypothetical protein
MPVFSLDSYIYVYHANISFDYYNMVLIHHLKRTNIIDYLYFWLPDCIIMLDSRAYNV